MAGYKSVGRYTGPRQQFRRMTLAERRERDDLRARFGLGFLNSPNSIAARYQALRVLEEKENDQCRQWRG